LICDAGVSVAGVASTGLQSPIFEPALATGTINPAEIKSRRDVLDAIETPPSIAKRIIITRPRPPSIGCRSQDLGSGAEVHLSPSFIINKDAAVRTIRPNPKGQIPLILDNFKLIGKTALVTGSSRGLGAGIAVALAQAGAKVAVHGSASVPRATQKLVAKTGAESIALAGDVGDAAVCARLVDETVQHFGSIDILVNNAGIIRRSPAADHSEEDWNAVIDINLSSVFRLTQLAGRHMLAKGSGKIINIASVLTFQGGIRVPSYAAAKGGVGQLTKAFANEWASKGVNVNAIAPGYMATDNTEALQNDPVRARQILDRIPAGRWGEPEDLAGAVVFLASAASDYVHGHILVVDGGWLNR
jgi:2-deoxy-D-gluconate 3-dehydrogenase